MVGQLFGKPIIGKLWGLNFYTWNHWVNIFLLLHYFTTLKGPRSFLVGCNIVIFVKSKFPIDFSIWSYFQITPPTAPAPKPRQGCIDFLQASFVIEDIILNFQPNCHRLSPTKGKLDTSNTSAALSLPRFYDLHTHNHKATTAQQRTQPQPHAWAKKNF